MQTLPGFPTCGIGSMPYLKEEPALVLIRRNMPVVPHWPQLPKRSRQEHFVHQFLQPLVSLGLITVEGDRAFLDPEANDFPGKLTEFYSLFLAVEGGDPQALECLSPPQEAASGLYAFHRQLEQQGAGQALYLKGQMAGPLSVALNLGDREKRPAYYHPELKELLLNALSLSARWQAHWLTRLGAGAGVRRGAMVFVDEPAVAVYGNSNYITLDRGVIINDLSRVAEAIRLGGAVPGAHSCAAADWTILLEAGFEVLSFDAFEFFDSLAIYRREVECFLSRGGVLAWGIVPTSGKVFGETAESLTSLLLRQVAFLNDKGFDVSLLKGRLLISPSCGTGTLEVSAAERVYHLSAAVADRLSVSWPY